MLDLSPIGVALHWWLIGSYRTGEFIVYTGISLVEMIISAVRSFNSVSSLIYEGSTLWFRDIHECLCGLQEFVHNCSSYLSEVSSSLGTVAGKAVYAPFSILTAILASIRELLLLLGSSCLFLLSLPPLFLFHFIDMLLHVFKAFCSFIRYVTDRLTEHTTDIQSLEILIGLVVGCGLILVALNAMKYMVKLYFNYKNTAGKALRTIWRKVRTRMTFARRKRRENDCKLQDTELCIVCFTKARSVCLLPCRHLCLCTTCTESLPYPLCCPLCRQRTEDLIHVYL